MEVHGMDINNLKQLKKKTEMTNEKIAELSGIPVEIIDDIFSGKISNPQYMTLLAIEQVLVRNEKIPFFYDEKEQDTCLIQEDAAAYNFNARTYNMTDINKISAGMRVELIDGKLYFMTTPSRMHQFLITKILISIGNHIEKRNGKCHVYTAPLGVRLFADDETWVVPDILVVCKKDILTDKGCDGAPDIVVEIVSPGNAYHDYITKLMKYRQAGVREYWIVDPEKEKVFLIDFENEENGEYTYEDAIRSKVLEGFEVRIVDFIEEF